MKMLKLLILYSFVCVVTADNDEEHTPVYLEWGPDERCPPPVDVCDFISMKNDEQIGNVSCTITEPCLNLTLSQLPDNITDLTVRVEIFPDEGVSFSRFTFLARLQILWTHSFDDLLHADLSQLTDSGLFEGLGMLTSLKLSIPISVMNNSLLLDLVNLTELDLSNIGYFTTSKFASLYRGSHLEKKPIEHLNLKRISGVGTSQDRLFLLKELLPLFKGSTINILDLSQNRDIYCYPGFSQYLPNLKNISVHGNAIRYIDEAAEVTCTILELILNRNLIYGDAGNMGQVGSEVDYFGVSFLQDAMKCITKGWKRNTCVCTNFNRTCGAYFTEDIDCTQFPEFTADEVLNFNPVLTDPLRYCDDYVLLPMPQSLKVMRVSNTQLVYKDKEWQNQTICFQPNNLTVFDASFEIFNIHKDISYIIGWDNLEVLDLAYSSWGYFFS